MTNNTIPPFFQLGCRVKLHVWFGDHSEEIHGEVMDTDDGWIAIRDDEADATRWLNIGFIVVQCNAPMKVIHGIRPDLFAAAVVTLGMFDGVHLGHQALLRACRRHADHLGLPAVALTYAPHPLQVLRPEMQVRLLTPQQEKLEHLARFALDYVVLADFTLAFSQLSAENFLHDVLMTSLHPQVVVVGYRTTFGHAREGTADVLRAMGNKLGFQVEVVEPVEIADRPISSSQIRASLEQGDVAMAAEMLGYRYQMTGVVSVGDGRGHAIGIPTANIEIPSEKLIPADGVYAVDACAPGVKRRAVMNIGCRPTFDRPHSLEVHLLDFHGDLYQHPLTVTFLSRLRDVRTFPDNAALLQQIQQDIAQARLI